LNVEKRLSMARHQDLWLVPIVCPECGRGLPSKEDDVIFFCAVCQAAWELSGDSLARRELLVVSGAGNLQLPFWVFPFKLTTPDGICDTMEAFHLLIGNVNPVPEPQRGKPPLLFAPAFSSGRPQQMLRTGKLLTVRNPYLTVAKRQLTGTSPITLGEVAAKEIARIIAISTITSERQKNLRFVQSLSIQFGKGTLCIIPFDMRDNRLFNGEFNLEI
jgi:hypothetical protein